MRIAFDARMAGHSGIGRYLRSLVGAIGSLPGADGLSLDLFLNPGQDDAWIPVSPRLSARRFPREVPVYSWREWTAWGPLLEGRSYDLLHVPHFNAPWRASLPVVVTFHDAVYWRFPQATGSLLGGAYARFMLERAVRRAGRVIAVSRSSADDAVRLLGADPGRLEVIHHGPPAFLGAADPARTAALREAWKIPGDYVLYVGNFLGHKRLDVLLKALGALRDQGRILPLVLAGRGDARAEALGREAREMGLEGQVAFAGALDDAALAAAYAGARVLACPSPWEGFGLTMLEGFAAGVPVVAVAGGAAPEVAGGAALLAEPGDAAGMAARLLEAWSDGALRERLAAAGRERLKAFSWPEAARRTLAVYRGLRTA